MNLNIFQLILLIIAFVFFLVSIDFFKTKKFTFAHLLLVGGGSAFIAGSFLYPWFLNHIAHTIGLATGADMVVYFSLVMVVWMFLGLYNRQIKSDIALTDMMRSLTIEQARWSIDDDVQTVIIMPTYRQDEKVIRLIHDILALEHGVIRVDDGYNGDLYQSIANKFKSNVVILRHPRNMGQGAALQTGHKYAQEYTKAEYVIHFDSDGQHQSKDIQSFTEKAEKNKDIDIIFGSRFLPGAGKIPPSRARNKKLQLLFMKLFVGIKLSDTNNGFRLIRTSALNDVVITMNDYSHASEIESFVVHKKLRYGEVPIDVLYGTNEHGQSLRNAINIAKRIIYRNLFFK